MKSQWSGLQFASNQKCKSVTYRWLQVWVSVTVYVMLYLTIPTMCCEQWSATYNMQVILRYIIYFIQRGVVDRIWRSRECIHKVICKVYTVYVQLVICAVKYHCMHEWLTLCSHTLTCSFSLLPTAKLGWLDFRVLSSMRRCISGEWPCSMSFSSSVLSGAERGRQRDQEIKRAMILMTSFSVNCTFEHLVLVMPGL